MSKNSVKKVYVGMSGGVDSSLSAALLVEAGYDVMGVYMKNWSRDLPGMQCPWAEDLADAKRVAVQLGIPFRVFDFEREYKHLVVDYMIAEYARGRTPNPDIMCNQEVKFGLFLRAALAEGADFIATGHYARTGTGNSGAPVSNAVDFDVEKSFSAFFESPRVPLMAFEKGNQKDFSTKSKHPTTSDDGVSSPTYLLRAKDTNKDQTYFLYRVTAAALARTIFPIGGLTKPEVRAEAKRRGLATAGRRDSQGICFVGNVGIRGFLGQYVEAVAGDIVERETRRVVGRHDGAIFYTFGQRHNLGVGGGLPYYVVGKDMEKNEVYVSTDLNNREFWRAELRLSDRHWINDPPVAGRRYQVRLRHRAPLVDCEFDGETIKLAAPERAVAAGQSAVIYDGEVVLGGGVVLNS
ncbi:MAG: tRNA-specific 2-thiouridylase [Candidatus Nomurabacteria bacterium]|jgi:tRNA-specific 2-thiouridylase|nr:tRNA-specific 2-thiouridylase [Candidatus Nomurabacteria bacterium]